jgi:hypothetical protein
MTAQCSWPDSLCAEATKRAQERRRASSNEDNRDAPQATLEALMFSLRERGTRALPDAKRRLSQLNDRQLAEVGDRLRRLKPHIARAWTAEEVKVLIRTKDILNDGRKINERADTASARREKSHPFPKAL